MEMKHNIKNIDPNNRDIPTYDGTGRFIKFGKIKKVELTKKVRYMINNGLFEDLGKAVETEQKEAIVDYNTQLPHKKRVKQYNKKIKRTEEI